MRSFEKLPPKFQNDEVKHYYDIIAKKSFSLVLKGLRILSSPLLFWLFL